MTPRGARPGRRPERPRISRPGARLSRPDREPVPVERGRAAGVTGGLLLFTAGFAAAGLLVLGGHGGSPGYQVVITLGLVGIGVSGFFLHRGTVALPEAKIWSPVTLRALIEPLALPVVPVIAALYLLAAIGLIGNVVVPLALRH